MPAHSLILGLAATLPQGGGARSALDGCQNGLAGVWSVARRLLSGHAGALIRVRRSSDDAEMDIGHTAAGVLDTAALLVFAAGGGSAYVVKVYDQSGLGRDLVQGSASAQRRIVNAGTVELQDGLPTMRCTATGQGYATATFSAYAGATLSGFARAVMASSGAAYSRVLSVAADSVDYLTPAAALLTQLDVQARIGVQSSALNVGLSQAFDSSFVGSTVFDGTNCTVTTASGSSTGAFSDGLAFDRVYVGMYQVGGFSSAAGDAWAEGAVYAADKSADAAAIREALTP